MFIFQVGGWEDALSCEASETSRAQNPYLEDHPMTCKWLGSPPFISHEVRPFGMGITRSLGDLLSMVINHLLTGMILQVNGKPLMVGKSAQYWCRRGRKIDMAYQLPKHLPAEVHYW